MNSIEERRLFYIFEYLERETQREALEALQNQTSPQTRQEITQLNICINQNHDTTRCFNSVLGHSPSAPELPPLLRQTSRNLIQQTEAFVRQRVAPWNYRFDMRTLPQLLSMARYLLHPDANISPEMRAFYLDNIRDYRNDNENHLTFPHDIPLELSPAEIHAILAPAPEAAITFLIGIFEFYNQVLISDLANNGLELIQELGRGNYLRNYSPTLPATYLTPVSCADASSYTRHELEISGLTYKIPVFVNIANESNWETIRDFLTDALNLLKGVLTPQDFNRFLHPPGEPDFSIVVNDTNGQSHCDIAGLSTAAHYNGDAHQMVIRNLDFIDRSVYTTFFHEIAHGFDNIFLSREDRENVGALHGWLLHLFREGAPPRLSIPIIWPACIPSITGPSSENFLFPHSLENYKETFADFIAEYLVDLFLGNNEESNPHQRARHRIVNRFFSLGGIYPRAFSVPNIEAAYRQEGIALALREHSPQHFELGLSFEGSYASSLQRGIRFGAYGLFHRRERLTFSAGLTLGVEVINTTPRLPILAQIGLSTSPHRTFRGEIYLGGGVNAIGRPIAGIAEIGVRTYLQPSGGLGRVSFYTGFFAQSTIPEFHPVLGVNLGLIFFPNMGQN